MLVCMYVHVSISMVCIYVCTYEIVNILKETCYVLVTDNKGIRTWADRDVCLWGRSGFYYDLVVALGNMGNVCMYV